MRFMPRMGNGGAVQAAFGEELSDDAIRTAVPAIFACDKHASRSERYTYIPTAELLAGMRREGFVPTMAAQGGSRIEGKLAFTRHVIRFRHASQIDLRGRGEAFEVLLLNSHDGTSSYRMMSGLIRFACLNGLVAGEIYGDVRVSHRERDAMSRVIEGAYEVLGQSDRVLGTVDEWRSIPLRREEREILAEGAHVLRFPERDNAPFGPGRLLSARRPEDAADNSLWGTFNRIQENAIRGGQWGEVRDIHGRTRATRTREVAGIDRNTALNRALWTLSERMAELAGRSNAA